MADQLITAVELQTLLGLATIDTTQANLVIAAATAVVQEAADNQRLVQATGATHTMLGVTGCWLELPQRPVTTVGTVALDGVTLTLGTGLTSTTYKRPGSGFRLWRDLGWQTYYGVPSEVVVGGVTHGYATGSQDLELARSGCIALSRGVLVNPDGVLNEKIDDYAVAYEKASALMESSPSMKAALLRKYGLGVTLVSLGG